ncbi:MAG: hypothetical protein MJ213_00180 [Bacilli bacterium]|nr:hypothetical protein [Bacilli bacterium]
MAKKVTKKSAENKKYKKWASKSWKPFLIMSIAGAVVLSVAVILYTIGIAQIAEFPESIQIPEKVLVLSWTYLCSAFVCFAVATGLLGPGVPLMIITIVKKNKARKKLGLKK